MRFLYISSGDVFTRHELGFVATLSMLGNVDVVDIEREASGVERRLIGSDNGVWDVMFYYIPCKNVLQLTRCKLLFEKIIDFEKHDAVFATPRLSAFLAEFLSKSGQPINTQVMKH